MQQAHTCVLCYGSWQICAIGDREWHASVTGRRARGPGVSASNHSDWLEFMLENEGLCCTANA